MVEEAKARLQASRRAIHEAKFSALSKEIEALNPERDALADQRAQILDEQSKLYGQMIDEVRAYDNDGANALEANRGRQHTEWMRSRFARWLG
jgi:predicted  nucleic acid-binding Zn-ribbon protein